ncbi:hypothetical protein [Streptomyces litchfieldiae]|uniref:Uncharacterized protein n=1 Tax=Streptomyces litchfieldiae TaxID=3075543 RepID=A0ABU2MNA9_9ACTN|nr:hypothetical protein [Streptomyces sp. DSM 44938]MDT0343097.1 hypothetical protein [Streptomyces sp. DSM 44938]
MTDGTGPPGPTLPTQRAGEEDEAVFGGGPPAWLYLPTDWFNFLEDGDDPAAAARRYAELMARLFPNMPPQGHQEIVDGLMLWRERLWSNGFLAHGIITVPDSEEYPAAMWQVLVTTMKLPATHPELDPTALLRRLIPQSELSFTTHVETYETEMGLGIGVIGRPPMTLPGGAEVPGTAGKEVPKVGMAAALSFAPGAEYGILAVGVSVNPEQDQLLAMLIALIAGKSKLVTEEPEDTPAPTGTGTGAETAIGKG